MAWIDYLAGTAYLTSEKFLAQASTSPNLVAGTLALRIMAMMYDSLSYQLHPGISKAWLTR